MDATPLSRRDKSVARPPPRPAFSRPISGAAHRVLLFLGYLAIVTLPLGLAWAADMPPRSARNEIASTLGLLAYGMILAEFLLSGRFRMVSGGVGLDVTIRLHQALARAALAFALLHPFLYAWLPGPHRPWDPTRQLTLTTEFAALAPGIGAFVLLPALVLVSIHRDALGWRYETWRLLHGLGALLIAGLVLLHALWAGRYSADRALAWTWIVLAGFAALSLLLVYGLRPLWQTAHPWRVRTVRRIAPRQWSLHIAPEGHGGLRFKAGQFVWLNIGHSPFTLAENPFSIASAPADGPELEFIIKDAGDGTDRIGLVAPGTVAYMDGPHGTLTVDGRREPGIVLVAGGVGLAPLLGILRQMTATNDPRAVTLLNANRDAGQIVHRDELDRLDARPNRHVVQVLENAPPDWTGETGRVDGALLERVLPGAAFDRWLFVLCGPPAMMTAVERALRMRGVAAGRILSEKFRYD